jgi:DNA ligase-1
MKISITRIVTFALCVWLAPALHAQNAQAPVPPSVLLASEASAGIDPAPYLISEKYDGVRGLWDGKTLRTRAGNVIAAPAWFIAKLPRQSLDGELWLGRGQFEMLSGIVRKTTPPDDEWRQVKYMVFELPNAPGTFTQRYSEIKRIAAEANFAQLIAVEQFRIKDNAALKRKLAKSFAREAKA